MKLIDKLAKEYEDTKQYSHDPRTFTLRAAFEAGFRKGRDMSADVVLDSPEPGWKELARSINTVGEEEVE